MGNLLLAPDLAIRTPCIYTRLGLSLFWMTLGNCNPILTKIFPCKLQSLKINASWKLSLVQEYYLKINQIITFVCKKILLILFCQHTPYIQGWKYKYRRFSTPPDFNSLFDLQSLVNRIMNNVTIVVSNLILKFVEDDIVLSVNVKSVESFSVDQVSLSPITLLYLSMSNLSNNPVSSRH